LINGAPMKTINRRNGSSGFTLVELIIVMLILSVVMVAAMSLFIPAKRASVVQTGLADVQGNLRLALETIAQDFRVAGFLRTGDAISGYSLSVGDPTVSDPIDTLVINTRTVSGRYGRIETPPADAGAFQFVLYDELQVDSFHVNDFVAIVQPVTGEVLNSKIYKVSATDRTARTVTLKNTDNSAVPDNTDRLNLRGTITGNVLLVAPIGASAPSDINRTITYSWVDADDNLAGKDTLVRIIDGKTQFLARNVSFLQFIVKEDADGDPHKVTIEIEGKTDDQTGAVNDPVGSQKSKRLRTVVSLRNV
jgi:prepilin-type N-terminal cleavage/methylation domain-containing protein